MPSPGRSTSRPGTVGQATAAPSAGRRVQHRRPRSKPALPPSAPDPRADGCRRCACPRGESERPEAEEGRCELLRAARRQAPTPNRPNDRTHREAGTSKVEPAPAPNLKANEVIVVASKRDTPVARFAGQWLKIDGEEFAPLGVPGTEAIEARSVGFSSTHLGAGRNKLFIRGIADPSFSGPTQSPVGQYFGDMRTGYSGPDPDLKLVDMQSVEILEGPQGTLYGSGALGGIVLLKPNMPDFGEFSGTRGAGTTADLAWRSRLRFARRCSMLHWQRQRRAAGRCLPRAGGRLHRQIGHGREGHQRYRRTGGRATLTAELVPGWFVDLAGVGQRIDGDDSQYADDEGSGLTRDSLVDQPFSSDFSPSLVVRKDGGPVRFRSTTGASWQDVDENFDASTNGEDPPARAAQQGTGGQQ